MSLKEMLQNDMNAAMRAKDDVRRNTLRLLLAAIKQEEVDGRTTLDDAGVLAVLTKQAKQRRESIADSERAGRADLAAIEQGELEIIQSYLPTMLERADIEQLARQIITEQGATGPKDMGRVMGALMPHVKGRADGKVVSDVVRVLLQQ
jgi:uncharacterized protein YqeY